MRGRSPFGASFEFRAHGSQLALGPQTLAEGLQVQTRASFTPHAPAAPGVEGQDGPTDNYSLSLGVEGVKGIPYRVGAKGRFYMQAGMLAA